MDRSWTVAVVGATGVVGRELVGALAMSGHPADRVRLLASAEVIRARAPASVEVEPDGDDACVVTVGSDDAAMVAKYLAWWDAPFEVLDSPQLLAEVTRLAQRYADASQRSRTSR